ncbi:MAG: hypothetical protein J0H01_27390 [Rhizobiales bacterium]|nr:hypothetical protein [Hyphomicrobiales bacterium]
MDSVSVSIATAMVVLTAVASVAGAFAVTRHRSERAEQRADRAEAKAESVECDLAEYKLHAAQQFVTDAMLVKLEGREVDAINRLGDRLDRVLEAPRRPGAR